MEILVKYAQSAFKHNITEANIRHAILNWRYDDVIDEQTVRVFHAMKCTNTHRLLLEI